MVGASTGDTWLNSARSCLRYQERLRNIDEVGHSAILLNRKFDALLKMSDAAQQTLVGCLA
jgi:hypothetical protein